MTSDAIPIDRREHLLSGPMGGLHSGPYDLSYVWRGRVPVIEELSRHCIGRAPSPSRSA